MTEQQKQQVLAWIMKQADAAERAGLMDTAKSWDDTWDAVEARPAAEMILAKELS